MVRGDFACQVLAHNGFKMYTGTKQIFLTNNQLDEYPLIQQHYMTNSNVIREGEPNLVDIDYTTLRRLGLVVISKKVNFQSIKHKTRIMKMYVITKPHPSLVPIVSLPKEHLIKYDVESQTVQLFGQNAGPVGVGPLVNLPNVKRELNDKRNLFDAAIVRDKTHSILKELLPFNISEEQRRIDIAEIPIGITDFGEIACIESSRDAFSFEICGSKRLGKSLLMHNLKDNIFYKWKCFCTELNDVNSESVTNCFAWEANDTFASQLSYLNIHSVPLPMAYIHLNNSSLRYVDYENVSGYKTSIPSTDMFGTYFDTFFGSDKTQWATHGSTKYMKNLIFDDDGKIKSDALFKHTDLKECLAFIESAMQEKSQKSSKPKIKEIIKNIWSEKLTDKSSGIEGKWFLQFPDGKVELFSPWIACNIAGIFPVLETTHIKGKHYHPEIIRYVTEDIYYNQKNNPHMKNKDNYLFVDEMIGLLKEPRTGQVFETIIREGGSSNIGMVYVAHSPKDVMPTIRQHSAYVACFGLASDTQAKGLLADLGLDSSMGSYLKQQKKFQCTIFPKQGYRVTLYDVNGSCYHTTEPVKIKNIFPSISAHKAPKAQEVEEDESGEE